VRRAKASPTFAISLPRVSAAVNGREHCLLENLCIAQQAHPLGQRAGNGHDHKVRNLGHPFDRPARDVSLPRKLLFGAHRTFINFGSFPANLISLLPLTFNGPSRLSSLIRSEVLSCSCNSYTCFSRERLPSEQKRVSHAAPWRHYVCDLFRGRSGTC
jgi:hypothetical protein